jgi:hypothetical protein
MAVLEEIPKSVDPSSLDHIHFPMSLLTKLAAESMNLVLAPVLDTVRYQRERLLTLNLSLLVPDQVLQIKLNV